MFAMPYMVKTLKNLLLRKQKADDLESLYAALGARVLPNLFKWWLWVDLDLFYGIVKFGPFSFCMGKGKTMNFSQTMAVYDLKLATHDRSDKKLLVTSKDCPLWAVCPLPWSYIHVLNQRDFFETCNKWVNWYGVWNYVVWPTFFLMNVFIALKGSHFWFYIWLHCSWCCAVWRP